MKKNLFIILIFSFVTTVCYSQTKPFEVFENAVNAQQGGFNGSKELLSKIFKDERDKLGESFETELWKYLGNDVEKHYWIGSFLQSKSYLHGNLALPELALKVWQNSLELLKNKTEEKSVGMKFKTLVLSTILATKLDKKDLAVSYKSEAENITKSGFNTKIHTPFLYDYESCIYYATGTDPKPLNKCPQLADDSPKERTVMSGVLNGKAIELAKPKYPKAFKKQKIGGIVMVKVLIDETGKVVFAEGIKGPTELYEVSVEAALKSRFSPTKMSGIAVKVSGFINYNFKF
jgi:hypothetical protein